MLRPDLIDLLLLGHGDQKKLPGWVAIFFSMQYIQETDRKRLIPKKGLIIVSKKVAGYGKKIIVG